MRKILLISALLLLSACQNPFSSKDDSAQPPTQTPAVEELPEGDFSFNEQGSFEGDLYVKGYASTEEVTEPFCEENCATYQYVFFNVLESGNAAFAKFLEENRGNSFTGEDRVGIGCVEGGRISYVNDSDERGRESFGMGMKISSTILGSSEDAPISLRLRKNPLSGGSGAPACYSHFTEVFLHQ